MPCTGFASTSGATVNNRRASVSRWYTTPPGHLAGGAELLARIRASGELESVAARASEAFVLPRNLVLRMTTCGAPDAWFNRVSGELTLCYERIAYFRELAIEQSGLHDAPSQALH